MLKLWTLLLFALLPYQRRGPVFTPDADMLDDGTIHTDDPGILKLWYTTSGDETLIIQCNTSCGCTVPEWPSEQAKPGERGWVQVRYDTHRIGRFNTVLYLQTHQIMGRYDHGELMYKTYDFRIKGEVLKVSGEKQKQNGKVE